MYQLAILFTLVKSNSPQMHFYFTKSKEATQSCIGLKSDFRVPNIER